MWEGFPKYFLKLFSLLLFYSSALLWSKNFDDLSLRVFFHKFYRSNLILTYVNRRLPRPESYDSGLAMTLFGGWIHMLLWHTIGILISLLTVPFIFLVSQNMGKSQKCESFFFKQYGNLWRVGVKWQFCENLENLVKFQFPARLRFKPFFPISFL